MGEVIGIWDYLVATVYVVIVIVWAKRIQSQRIVTAPIYKYYTIGLFAKVFAGLVFCMIYVYYYGGGDTTGYFQGGQAMVKLFFRNPSHYISILFGNDSITEWMYFNDETSWPPAYMWRDPQAMFVIRFISPLLLLSFNTYLGGTILLSVISYSGIWKLYKLFANSYPLISKELAIAFLFVPSVVFWGSGILKDTITLAATCWFTSSIYILMITGEKRIMQIIYLVISSFLLISIKPYIFIALMPGTIIWIAYERLQRIRSNFLRVIAMPVILVVSITLIAVLFGQVGAYLGKYSSVDSILETVVVTQQDLKSERYGAHSYDVGDFDASLSSMLVKAPVSIAAALFRPFIWEVGNVVMLLSGIENALLLVFSLWILLKVGPIQIIRTIASSPILLFTFSFSILFAFAVGISSANFGAMVRYKIPSIPFFITSLILLKSYVQKKI